MKINALIATLLVILTPLMSSLRLSAQDATDGRLQQTATISDDFVIQLPVDQEVLAGKYVLDIKNIPFKSKEALDRFCSIFSIDYQWLSGDFERKEISLEFDLSSIGKRNLNIKQVGAHLKVLAGRMENYFQNYNN